MNKNHIKNQIDFLATKRVGYICEGFLQTAYLPYGGLHTLVVTFEYSPLREKSRPVMGVLFKRKDNDNMHENYVLNDEELHRIWDNVSKHIYNHMFK